MERRTYLVAAVGLFGGIAGCASTDEEPEPVGDGTQPEDQESDDTSTSDDDGGRDTREVDAAIGDLVEGDNIHLVVEDVERGADFGKFLQPDEGNEYLAIGLAMKNVSDDFLTISNLLQSSIEDDEGYSYDQTFVGDADAQFNAGQFAPGEVERGQIAYEIPEEASGLALRFDFDVSIFGSVERAYIDLESTGDDVTLEQNLQVDVYDIGQTIEFDDIEVTVNEVRYESALGSFAEPDEGNEYAVVDISVANDTGEDKRVSTVLQMLIKDGNGYSHQEDWAATTELDRPFDETSPIPDGSKRRGEVVYEVPENASPLYWVFEFNVWVEGDKTFWQVA